MQNFVHQNSFKIPREVILISLIKLYHPQYLIYCQYLTIGLRRLCFDTYPSYFRNNKPIMFFLITIFSVSLQSSFPCGMNGGRMMVFLVSIFYFAIAEGHWTLLNKCVHSLPSTPSLRLMVGCYCHHITPLLPYSLWRWKIEDNWPAIIEWITTVFMGLFSSPQDTSFPN